MKMYSIEQEQRKLTEENQARLCYFITHHVSQIKQLLKCSICFEVYERPTTVFHCFHVFCEDCIKTYLEFSTNKEPPCPICQKPIPRNNLRPNHVVEEVAEFINSVCGRIHENFGCDVSKPPSFKTILTKIKEKKNETVPQTESVASNSAATPPDYNLILKARKILISSNKQVISSLGELPHEIPSISCRDGSLKTPTSNKRTIQQRLNNSNKKDLFDTVKESPSTNPFFKGNKLNKVAKTYAIQKPPKIEVKNKTCSCTDEIKNFEDNSNKIQIIQWLNDNRNNFDSMPLTQQKNIPELQIPFDLPSVSQIRKHKVDPVNPSQINRQKVEQNKIRQKSELVTHLSRINSSSVQRQNDKRTRSEDCIKVTKTNQKLKRHSISAVEQITIEQFNSEEENRKEASAIINVIEEECLKNMEIELLKSKKPTKPARVLRSPKRSKRISSKSSKLLQTIEKTNKRLKNTSGWARVKDIKKTLQKVEIKPKKLNVSRTSRCNSIVTSTIKETDASKISKPKEKIVEPVVILEKMDFDVNLQNGKAYDLDLLESYFCKQFENPEIPSKKNSASSDSLGFEQSKNKVLVRAMIHNTDQDDSVNDPRQTISKQIETPINIRKLQKKNKKSLEDSLDKIIEVGDNLSTSSRKLRNKNKNNDSNRETKIPSRTSNEVVKKLKTKEDDSKTTSGQLIKPRNDDKSENEIELSHQSNHEIEKNEKNIPSPSMEEKSKSAEEVTETFSKDLNHKSKIVDDDDDFFLLPTQVILGNEKSNLADDEDIFSVPTQVIQVENLEASTLEDTLKHKIESLQTILNKPNFIPEIKKILKDIEEIISKQEPPIDKLTKDREIQPDFKEASFISHDVSVQTIFQEEIFKHVAIQTDSFDSPRGFQISSTDQFCTQPFTNTEMQTDAMVCPKCSFVLGSNPKPTLISNPTAISSNVLLGDSNVIKNLSDKYMLSESFDLIDFETQDVLKGKNINKPLTLLKGSIAGQENKENQIQNKIKNVEPKLSQKQVQTPTFVLPSQPQFKTPNKKSYKRIRKPSSDSDSDDGIPKNVTKNKFIRYDLSLHFASEQQEELVSSGDSEGVDYGQYLQNVLKKCDEDLMAKKPSQQQKAPSLKRPAKRSKTQDMIDECKLILQEACSGAITFENTENTNTVKHDVTKPSKLTLTTMEEEFQHDFNAEDDMEIDKDCYDKNKDLGIKKDATNKFSESLFSTADPFSKSIIPMRSPVQVQNRSKIESKEKIQENANRLLTQSSLDELIDVLDEFNGSFEDNPKIEKNIQNTENKIVTEDPTNSNQIKILQNIVITKDPLIEEPQEKNEIDKGNESDDMFFSDSDVVETTPQKNKPISLEKVSILSQVYYIPEEKIILPPLLNESPDIIAISSLDPLTCLGEVFIPPPEFQDTPTDDTLVDKKLNSNQTNTKSNNSVIDLIHTQMEVEVNKDPPPPPSSSLTPDLLFLPQTHELIDVSERKKPFITSTQYTNDSQVLSSKTLNLSAISMRGSVKAINPLLAAQNAKCSPLTVVKCTTPPPQRRPILATSTPKQKSILNFVRTNENAHNSQTSQNSIIELTPINKPCVACTRMSKEQLFAITSLSNRKLISYSNTFSATVTHMIVDVNKHNRVKDHTMKYVSAVAAGIWVLNFTWVEECLKQNQLLPEELFEALDMSGMAGPKKSRLMRTTNPLLKGFKIHAAPAFKSTTQKEVEKVIKLLGGEVVPRLDDLITGNGKICLIITEAKESEDYDIYEMWLEMLKVATVDLEWLSRSVGQYEILTLKPFTLCSEELICDLGYPPELLTDMPVSFSHTYVNENII